MIYLYKKTHNKTGLQYLGKTLSKDPYKYLGSGTYWTNHLKVHGNDVTTEIIKECQSEEELIHWGLHYSKLWNVVESDKWANLTEEAGPGGAWSTESRKKLSNSRKEILAKMTPEEVSNFVKNSCSSEASWTPERIEKMKLGMTGKKKTKTPALILAEEQRRIRIQSDPLKCGDANRGKSWKLVNGKRTWFTKEN